MRGENEETVFLKDYAETPYAIEKVELDVRIAPDTSVIRAMLTLVPRANTAPGTPLVLDGEELMLRTVAIDGLPQSLTAYEATPTGLTIHQPPNKRFVLETEVAVEPEKNIRLMGFYRSSGTWCTQCEPEGFRRITYYLDRPDVLAPFKVRMSADQALAPILLSNGNLVEQGSLPDGKHFAVWEDPFPKPAYLFAMVAGDLGSIHDEFTTASGRKVALGIYCTHGKESECLYAMDSLKRSMAWDERRFGREYDLDIFNIVAVSDFNFGAMENKGLNIFNDKLVFAKPESATDADYINIESVIAHEYFHNWTGDRITCRDWFQLCLKEGLTVYRDQEFSMDERSRPVNRIDDVRQLRQTQFPEDGGPLAHPARPDRYKEINNFYTATVYEKGAEIVRMLATLLGEAGFRKGMDLYFERHDGEATTIEAFIKVFEDSSGQNLQHFQQWYLQAGTPDVSVSDRFDAATQTYTLDIVQENRPTPGEDVKQPMVLPIKFGLIGPNGSPMNWASVSGGDVRDDLIVMDGNRLSLTFSGIPNRPVPSLFRGFSAPVRLTTNASEADQLFLARHDADPFNRWQALQDVSMRLLTEAVAGRAWSDAQVAAVADALEETLASKELDAAYKALALGLPTEQTVAREIGSNVDPDRIHQVRTALVTALVARLAPTLEKVYLTNDSRLAYSPDFQQTGRRSMKNTALALLVLGKGEGADKLAREQYERALNMTDRLSALSTVVQSWTGDANALLADFYRQYTSDPLVLDKWLSLNALATDDGALERIRAILASPDFPQNNPNRLRALMATFGMNNPTQFARRDGAGFRFLAEFVGDVDKRNPQVAARVLTAFRVWRSFESVRRGEAERALKSLQDSGGLSRNTADILERTLGA
ncbi:MULTISPECIES: aminopeptidase N [unclassified Devosia]|uniref:aminopeptidase N n=2 Tax=Devosia TaxID=46913 RepID=UPI0009663F46|nr:MULTISPECIES: aminopeptidase N [unclassified Devosia]MBN9360309.1 aminopeptidase N [Devosia sp.]OJX22331.1 MAG: aminopeptidase N [Devosia sp. 66-14]